MSMSRAPRRTRPPEKGGCATPAYAVHPVPPIRAQRRRAPNTVPSAFLCGFCNVFSGRVAPANQLDEPRDPGGREAEHGRQRDDHVRVIHSRRASGEQRERPRDPACLCGAAPDDPVWLSLHVITSSPQSVSLTTSEGPGFFPVRKPPEHL